jgi:hypothetical protein
MCFPGFTGELCERKNEFVCPPIPTEDYNKTHIGEHVDWSPCSGNGICKYGMCFCFPGFKGEDCSKKEVCKNDCSMKGICVEGKCVCNNKSKKDDCSEDTTEQKKQFARMMKFREVEKDEKKSKLDVIKKDKDTNNTINILSEDEKVERLMYSGLVCIMIGFMIVITFLVNRKQII